VIVWAPEFITCPDAKDADMRMIIASIVKVSVLLAPLLKFFPLLTEFEVFLRLIAEISSVIRQGRLWGRWRGLESYIGHNRF